MQKTIWSGGPGRLAPYKTTHVRIPLELKEPVTQLVDAWRRELLTGEPIMLPEAPSALPHWVHDALFEISKREVV